MNTGSSSRIVETRWRAGLFREGKRGTESRRSRVIEYRDIRSTVSRRSNAHLRDCEKLGSATVNKRRRRREDVARVESRVAIKVAIIGIRNARGKINNDSFPLIRKGKERPGRLSIGELLIKEREKKKKNGMTQGCESSLRIPPPRLFVKMHNLSQDNARFITSLPRLVY